MEYVDRLLEAVVLWSAVRAGAAALRIPFADGQGAALRADLRGRWTPWAAIVVGAVLAAGYGLGLVWGDTLGTLARDGSSQDWRVLTAPFVQDGAVGGAFNVVTAVVVLALAEWTWGRSAAVTVWLVGAWAPVSAAAGLLGYRGSAAHEHAYSAGSSGATYFLAGTLCAAALVRGVVRVWWPALAAPAVAVVMWAVRNDGHGVLLVEGAVLGVLLVAARAVLRRGPGRRRPAAVPDRCAATTAAR